MSLIKKLFLLELAYGQSVLNVTQCKLEWNYLRQFVLVFMILRNGPGKLLVTVIF